MREIDRRLYLHQMENELNERTVEYSFALKCIANLSPHTVLDVGSGDSPWSSLVHYCGCVVTAIDEMGSYYGKSFSHNRYFYVIKDDITKSKLTKTFDLVTCISTLEHIKDHCAAVRGIFNLTKSNGWLVFTFPYNETQYIDNVFKLPHSIYETEYRRGIPSICQVFSRREIDLWLQANQGKIVEQIYFDLFTGDLYGIGKRRPSPLEVKVTGKHHLTGILIQKL